MKLNTGIRKRFRVSNKVKRVAPKDRFRLSISRSSKNISAQIIDDIKQVTFFMEECKRMGVPVLGPDFNESVYKFTVNQKCEVRFGLGAV